MRQMRAFGAYMSAEADCKGVLGLGYEHLLDVSLMVPVDDLCEAEQVYGVDRHIDQ